LSLLFIVSLREMARQMDFASAFSFVFVCAPLQDVKLSDVDQFMRLSFLKVIWRKFPVPKFFLVFLVICSIIPTHRKICESFSPFKSESLISSFRFCPGAPLKADCLGTLPPFCAIPSNYAASPLVGTFCTPLWINLYFFFLLLCPQARFPHSTVRWFFKSRKTRRSGSSKRRETVGFFRRTLFSPRTYKLLFPKKESFLLPKYEFAHYLHLCCVDSLYK